MKLWHTRYGNTEEDLWPGHKARDNPRVWFVVHAQAWVAGRVDPDDDNTWEGYHICPGHSRKREAMKCLNDRLRAWGNSPSIELVHIRDLPKLLRMGPWRRVAQGVCRGLKGKVTT